MILITLILMTAELPDPGKLGTVTFSGGLGAFVGALVAQLRRRPSTHASDAMRIGMLVGFGAGVLGWLAVFAIDLL
jgi:hypothetical protein